MKNVIIINFIANVGTEIQYFESLENAFKKLEIDQPYFLKAIIENSERSYTLESTSENYLRFMRERNSNITEHDVESLAAADVRYWKNFAIAIHSVNKRSPYTLPVVVVRRVADNDYIFYAEKTVNFGCEIHALTDARFMDEKPFTYEFQHPEIYYNFAALEKAMQLEKDEMAKFIDDGEIIIVKKDVEFLKNEGIRATEANFTDFLERIESDGLVFMGYLNSRLYYC